MDAWWWDMNTPQGVEKDYKEIEAQELPPLHEEPEATVSSSTASVDDYVALATEQDETPDFPEEIPILSKTSTASSSSSTSSAELRPVAISLSDYRLPQINYDRDSDSQKLVAVIGREFDEPRRIAVELQAVTPSEVDRRNAARMKFVPFVVRRSVLIKSNFDWQELKKYDLICMCYNASEARILLTGRDGFYSALLHNVEVYIGSNKVCFVVTNHSLSEHLTTSSSSSSSLISPQLQSRLYNQIALQTYLDNRQVLSWFKKPSFAQAQRLYELSQLDPNPQGQNCSIL